MERESGLYWVKETQQDEWDTAYWNDGVWYYNGERSDCDSSIKFEIVHPIRILNPDGL